MITVEDINEAFAQSARNVHQSFKRTVEATYGPMSDSAAGMLMAIGMGADIKLPNEKIVTAAEVSILLSIGKTPDEILTLMRENAEKPAAGTK